MFIQLGPSRAINADQIREVRICEQRRSAHSGYQTVAQVTWATGSDTTYWEPEAIAAIIEALEMEAAIA